MHKLVKIGRSNVVSQNGMAATSQPLSTLEAINILQKGGNAIDAAIAAFSQAIEGRGSLVSAMALYRLGQLERERDNAEAAVAYFDRLLEVSRNLFPRGEALIAKARAYQEAGDARAALANYQKIVEEFGESYIAGEARTQISELSVQLGLEPDIEGD